MASRRASVLGIAAVAVALARPAVARAEPAAVLVTIAAPADAATEVEAVIGDLLQGLPVEARFERAMAVEPERVLEPLAGAAPALARLWIDLERPARGAGAGVIVLVDSTWERVLVREVAREGRVDEVAREEVGQIVGAAVEALLAGEPVGVPRAEATAALLAQAPVDLPPPAPVDPEPPPLAEQAPRPAIELEPPPLRLDDLGPAAGTGLDLGVGYEVAFWSAGSAPRHGPLAQVGVAFRGASARPWLGLTVGVRLPAEIEGAGASARLLDVALRLEAGLEPLRRGRVSLRVGAALGALLTQVEPEAAGSGLVARPERLLAVATIRAGLELRVRLARRASLSLGAAADLLLPDVRYVVMGSAGNEDLVLDPWIVQPSLWLALAGEISRRGGAEATR